MEKKIRILVSARRIWNAFALKRIIKQKVVIDNRSNSIFKKIYGKQLGNSKFISISNCEQIIIKPYTSKLLFKSLFMFFDSKLEGLRRLLFKVKEYIGQTLKFLRACNIVPDSKIVLIGGWILSLSSRH